MATEEEDSAMQPYLTDERAQVPPDIDVNSIAVEIIFHPFKDVLAVGTVDGSVKIYSYSNDSSKSNHKLMSFRQHKESCNAVCFSSTGDYLFSGSSDTTIHAIDLDAGAISRRLTVDEGDAIYCLLPIDNYLLASGDDDGRLMVWDFRRGDPIMDLKPCQEYISSLTVSSEKRTLLVTSGEGSLSAFNLRSRKMEVQSELFDNEFLSAAIVKNQTKLVVTTSDGALNIFNWGEWGNISDRFPCHSGSVDTIVSVNEDVVCIGCEDGCVRAVEIHPNRIIGVVGKHDELPMEGLCISHDHRFLGSCSFDRKVKFHDLTVLRNVDLKKSVKHDKKKSHKLNSTSSNDNGFFSGLA